MKQGKVLKVLNVIIGILMLNQAVTGLLRERLPEETFEHFHIVGAVLLVTGTIFHLIKNWTWVKATYFKKK
jgi:undecaprenyl pyrophosphate phosphatase UppP